MSRTKFIALASLLVTISGCGKPEVIGLDQPPHSVGQTTPFQSLEGPSDGLPQSTLRIFVTRATVTGSIATLPGGADGVCRSEALAAGLTRRYIALLLGNSTELDQLRQHPGKVAHVEIAFGSELATEVAPSLERMLQYELRSSLDVFADGTRIPSTATALTWSGVGGPEQCLGWTQPSMTGAFGNARAPDGSALRLAAHPCSMTYRLYCVSSF